MTNDALVATSRFALFFDRERTLPTPYDDRGQYFAKARDRMDRTFALIAPYVRGATMIDVGASPFYLRQGGRRGARAWRVFRL